MALLIMDQKEFMSFRYTKTDLQADRQRQWNREWFNVKQPKYDISDIEQVRKLVDQVGDMLDNMKVPLREYWGNRVYENLIVRHSLIRHDTSHGYPQIGDEWFPPDKALAIIKWYQRLKAGIREIHRLTESLDLAHGLLLNLVSHYPGPDLKQDPDATDSDYDEEIEDDHWEEEDRQGAHKGESTRSAKKKRFTFPSSIPFRIGEKKG